MNSSFDDLTQTAETGAESGVLGLLRVAGAVQKRLEDALESLGLSMSKYMTLRHIMDAGGSMSLSSLADCRKCVRSNVTQLVDRLQVEGLVERVDDPADRRGVHARVTELGAQRLAAGTVAMREVEAELLGRVPDGDRERFARVLAALQQ